MRYAYKGSFDRAFEKLTYIEQVNVESSLDTLFKFFEKKITLPSGLGLKPIGKNYWEMRSGLKIRILFQIKGDLVTFYFVGNHDQVKRFVRN